MSKKYREKYGNRQVSKADFRKFCQRPGRSDEDGNPIYTTEQHHKRECDINEIINKYDKKGIISHVSKFEGRFGDMTGADFQSMQNQVATAKSMFEALPQNIKKEFDQSPAKLLEFMEDPGNREKAIELGLINENWTPETDGLGEHVPEGGNVSEPEEGEAQ